MKICCALLLALFTVSPGLARSIAEVPNPKAGGGTGWLSDLEHRVSVIDAEEINVTCRQLKADNGVEMVAVVIDRTDGRTPKEFAVDLFNTWHVGDARRNDGVMLLLVLEARKAHIEVGKALDDRLPPYRLDALLASQLVPYMKRGDVSGGTNAAMNALDRLVRELRIGLPGAAPAAALPAAAPVGAQRATAAVTRPREEPGALGWSLLGMFVLALGYALTLPFKLLGWLVHGRTARCEACQIDMKRLDSVAAQPHLDRAEQLEEQLGSASHEVWLCMQCSRHQIRTSGHWFTSYRACPSCHHYTAQRSSATVEYATRWSSGRGETTEDCQHCGYHDVSSYTISQLDDDTSSSSSSSDSSSSSSDSSFGGGSSDGGGGGDASW